MDSTYSKDKSKSMSESETSQRFNGNQKEEAGYEGGASEEVIVPIIY